MGIDSGNPEELEPDPSPAPPRTNYPPNRNQPWSRSNNLIQPQPDPLQPRYNATPDRRMSNQRQQQNYDSRQSRFGFWNRNDDTRSRSQQNQRNQQESNRWSPMAPMRKFNNFWKDALVPDRWDSRRR
jgi:hypothetical protein